MNRFISFPSSRNGQKTLIGPGFCIITIEPAEEQAEPSHAIRARVLLLFFGEVRSTRCLKRRSLARPYILRLRSFKRFTCPSRGPLLHGSVHPAKTADLSCSIPLANDLNSGKVLSCTRLSHVSNCCPVCSRIMRMNACARP